MSRIRDFLRALKECNSGNAMMLVAMGAPAIMGGAGFAVDTAQWYMIKREMQYAADQAAISGAWAQGKNMAAIDGKPAYQARAGQEFAANLSQSADYGPTSTVALAAYGGGTNNSVVVNATAQVSLPFSKFLTGTGITVSVRSQAVYEKGQAFNPCMLAIDPSTGQALHFSGNIDVDAGCGGGALSSANNAVYSNGNAASLKLNYVVTTGKIDDKHDNFAGQALVPGADSLFDPYSGLTPPDNSVDRGGDPCEATPTTYYANVEATPKTYSVNYAGNQKSKLTETSRSLNSTGTKVTETISNDSTPYTLNATFDSALATLTTGNDVDHGNKTDPRYTRTDTATLTSYYVTQVWQSDGQAAGYAQPGTYSNFDVKCKLQLASGVYVINGGTFNISSQHPVTGLNVMFVLKNGAGISISGGPDITLTPMSETQLIGLGIPAADAKKMEGMLIFEDPQSNGNTHNKINGNADLDLNGTVYLPKSHLDLAGNAGASSKCLMIASKTLKITGNTNLSTFCPGGQVHSVTAGYIDDRVRLVG